MYSDIWDSLYKFCSIKYLSLKYQKFTPPSGCKEIGIRKYEFVTKTQFLYTISNKSRHRLVF